jgi:hypothetical protein
MSDLLDKLQTVGELSPWIQVVKPQLIEIEQACYILKFVTFAL